MALIIFKEIELQIKFLIDWSRVAPDDLKGCRWWLAWHFFRKINFLFLQVQYPIILISTFQLEAWTMYWWIFDTRLFRLTSCSATFLVLKLWTINFQCCKIAITIESKSPICWWVYICPIGQQLYTNAKELQLHYSWHLEDSTPTS